MPEEVVIIDFQVDYSQLDAAIDKLEKNGAVDKKVAADFKATNAEIAKQGTQVDKVTKNLDNLAKSSKNLRALEQGIQEGITDALNEAGVSAEDFKNALGDAAKAGVKGTQSLKQELKGAVATLAELKLAGQENSKQYRDLSARAGELKDTLSDVANEVKNIGSDTRNLDGLLQVAQGVAGGFAIAQGAAALFGDESEELQKTLLKVNAAMAILQGLQSVTNILQKDSAASLLLLNAQKKIEVIQTNLQAASESRNIVVRGAAIVAQRALNAAMAANPIGLVVVALTALAAALAIYTRNSHAAAEATGELRGAYLNLTDALDESTEAIGRNTEREIIDLQKAGAKESEVIKARINNVNNQIEANQQAYNRNKLILDKGLGDEEDREKAASALNEVRKKNIGLRIEAQKLELDLAKQLASEQKQLEEDEKRRQEELLALQKRRLADAIFRLKTEQQTLYETSSAYIRLERAIISLQAEYDALGTSSAQTAYLIAKGAKDVRNTTDELIGAGISEVQKEFGKTVPELLKDVNKVQHAIADVGKTVALSIGDGLEVTKKSLDQTIQEIVKSASNSINALGQIYTVINGLSQERQASQQIEIENQRKQVDALLEAGAITEKEAEARQKRIDRQAAIQQTKAAQQAKQLAIFQAIISTAQAVVNALATPPAPVGIALAAVVGALGAAQIAAIASRPLPKFAKGKKDGWSGIGMIGEAGAELVERSGKMFVTTEPTITYLGPKDKVYTARETRSIIQNTSKPEIKTASKDFDYDAIGKSVAKYIKPGQGTNVNIDKDGFSIWQQEMMDRKNYYDKRYSSGF